MCNIKTYFRSCFSERLKLKNSLLQDLKNKYFFTKDFGKTLHKGAWLAWYPPWIADVVPTSESLRGSNYSLSSFDCEWYDPSLKLQNRKSWTNKQTLTQLKLSREYFMKHVDQGTRTLLSIWRLHEESPQFKCKNKQYKVRTDI